MEGEVRLSSNKVKSFDSEGDLIDESEAGRKVAKDP